MEILSSHAFPVILFAGVKVINRSLITENLVGKNMNSKYLENLNCS